MLDYWGVGGYAHDSSPVAHAFLDSLSKVVGFDLAQSEDAKVFTAPGAAKEAEGYAWAGPRLR